MDYNSMAEMKKKHSARIAIFLLCWLAAEIAAFIGVAQLVGGFANAVWLIFGFSFLGYLALNSGRMKSLAGRVVCILLMIPGFVTDIIAAIVAIKPLRSAIYARIMPKILPPEMIQSFKNEDRAKFSDFMRGMNGAGGAADFGARASKARGGGARRPNLWKLKILSTSSTNGNRAIDRRNGRAYARRRARGGRLPRIDRPAQAYAQRAAPQQPRPAVGLQRGGRRARIAGAARRIFK